MQILGIYLNKKYNCLKKGWYGFYADINWHDKYINNQITMELIDKLEINQNFSKQFYNYQGNQISISSIVGKNGAGKSTLLEVYNKIINNFAVLVKNHEKFKKYNEDYVLSSIPSIYAELYYENDKKIYCIKTIDEKVEFSNNEVCDLFNVINSLEDLSKHCFYTISANYSLYYKNENWLQQLFHKNDGYFTPIVLVPFRHEGIIDFEREKSLAEKRVMALSLLLFKESRIEFMEDYIPSFIGYELKNEDYYKRQRFADLSDFKNYEEEIQYKINKLKTNNEDRNEKRTNIYISNENFVCLQKEIKKYWESFFYKRKDEIYNYCKHYLVYKTLKSFTNYESLAKLLDFDRLSESLSQIIKDELWNENNINYINLKILTCKRFIDYTYKTFYKDEKILCVKDFLAKQKIKNTNNYHEIFSYLLPDFYDASCHYQKKNAQEVITLSDMSSGEQQLYTSLSYVVYHMKNALSNQNGNSRGKIPYKNFNLIIDEAELYYHPEYQRRFITDLLKLLNRSKVDPQGLNVTIVTHSPYIISDIPQSNILALEDGDVSMKLNKTLAANIYDLLGNQFFMDSYIGECSKSLIEKIITDCQSDNSLSNESYTFYKSFIDGLGDDFLSPTLSVMLEEKNGSSYEKRKEAYYEAKLKNLKNSIK